MIRRDTQVFELDLRVPVGVESLALGALGLVLGGWRGLITGYVVGHAVNHASRVALGRTQIPLLDRRTPHGLYQRAVLLGSAAVAIGGPVFAGWARGWVWALAAWIGAALALRAPFALRNVVGRRRRRRLARRLAEAGESPSDEVIDALVDFLFPSLPVMALVATYGASRARLRWLYRALVEHGAGIEHRGRWVPLAVFTTPTLLEYHLQAGPEDVAERVEAIRRAVVEGETLRTFGRWERSDPDTRRVIESLPASLPPRALLDDAVRSSLTELHTEARARERAHEAAAASPDEDRAFARRAEILDREIRERHGGAHPTALLYVARGRHGVGAAADVEAAYLRAGQAARIALEAASEGSGLFSDADLLERQRWGEVLENGGERLLWTFVRAQLDAARLRLFWGDTERAVLLLDRTFDLTRRLWASYRLDGPIAADVHAAIADLVDTMGAARALEDKPGSAELIREWALDYRTRREGPEAPGTVRAVTALADQRLAARRFDEALATLTLDPSVIRRLEKGFPRHAGEYRHERGMILWAKGEREAAAPELRKTVELYEGLGDKGLDRVSLRLHLASYDLDAARTDEGVAALGAAADELWQIVARSPWSKSDRLSLVRARAHHALTVQLASLVAHHVPDAHADDAWLRCYRVLVQQRGGAARAARMVHEHVLTRDDDDLRAVHDRLSELRVLLAEKELASFRLHRNDPGLQILVDEREAVDGHVRARVRESDPEIVDRMPQIGDAAQRLEDGALLVEYARLESYDFRAIQAEGESSLRPARYRAFVLRGGEDPALETVDLGPADRIDQVVGFARRAIAERSPTAERYGEALRKLIYDPLPAVEEVPVLRVVPDGDLCALPLEVLPCEEGHLLDRHAINYLASGVDLARPRPAREAFVARPPVVIGDPNFDRVEEQRPDSPPPAADSDPPELRNPFGAGRPGVRTVYGAHGERLRFNFPAATAEKPATSDAAGADPGPAPRALFHRREGARREAERVGELIGVDPWLGADATETRLKGVRAPSVLHLATEGYFLDPSGPGPGAAPGPGTTPLAGTPERLSAEAGYEDPLLRSGVALAGANTWLRGGAGAPGGDDGILTGWDVAGVDLVGTELVVLSGCETGLGTVHPGEGVLGLRRAFDMAGAHSVVMSLWRVPDAATARLVEDLYRDLLDGVPRSTALQNAQKALRKAHPEPYFWGAFVCHGDAAALPDPALRRLRFGKGFATWEAAADEEDPHAVRRRRAKAVEIFRGYVKADPADPAALDVLGWQARVLARHVPDPERRRRLIEEAEAAFRRAIEVDPGYVRARWSLGLSLAQRAQERDDPAERHEFLAGATERLRETVAGAPGWATGWEDLGQVLGQVADDAPDAEARREARARALDAHRRAVELDPLRRRAWSNLAFDLYVETEEADDSAERVRTRREAIEATRRALALDDGDLHGWRLLSRLLLAQGREADDEELVGIAAQAADEAAKRGETVYNQACFHALAGDTDRAFALLERALEEGAVEPAEVRDDPDWDGLRERPEYRRLVAGGE